MANTETIQIIAASTGLIGTVGGVLISYLSLRHTFRKDRHTIKLKIAKSMLAWPQPGTTKPKWSEEQLTFSVANTGHKEFTVVSVGVQIGRRSGALYINQPNGTVSTPYNLKPDATCNFWTEYKETIKKITKPKLYNNVTIRGYVSDYLGNTFYSNKMKIVLKETKRDSILKWIKKQLRELQTLVSP
jgi:hypothetical protein